MDLEISTQGHNDVIDITEQVRQAVRESGVADGVACVFVVGSTAAITSIEYEPGAVNDLKRALEQITPENADYEHHKRRGDRNGAAHIKSALMGPDLSVPVEGGGTVLGAWQQVVLVDFDEKPRQRRVVVRVSAA